jgi:hypothetical protein
MRSKRVAPPKGDALTRARTQTRQTSKPARPRCKYPQSTALAGDVETVLEDVAANRSNCSRFYLDTVESMSEGWGGLGGWNDHHQALARTHRLSDGSIYFFLAHSELDSGHGVLAQFRYEGPVDQEHVVETSPRTVAPMEELLKLDDPHPSDMAFLPDVNSADAGYLFVTEEYSKRRVSVCRWTAGDDFALQGHIFQGFPAVPGDPESSGGPGFLFIDRVDDTYYLGVASSHWGWGQLFSARANHLFPKCRQGALDVLAFVPHSMFPWPVTGGVSQTKLIRTMVGSWYLLAFRGHKEHGDDFVDVYGVRFSPFAISDQLHSTHVFFPAGNTGFGSTGTHYVEDSGRLLLATSYRWAEDEGPGSSSYVSRVDECPSW